MAWVIANQENPKLTVMTTNRISWNEATHQLMQSPVWIDLLYDAVDGKFALVGREDVGQYRVYPNADNTYHIECQRALNQMGMKNLPEDYEVTPEKLAVDPVPEPGEPPPTQTRFNGIWAPVKP